MVLGTKERIIAAKQFATERYIRSTHPVLYLPLWKRDAGGTNQIRSDDAYGHLATVSGALWTPQGRTFDGVDDQILIADPSSVLDLTTALTYEVWVKPSNGGDSYGRFLTKTSTDPYASRVVMLGKELDDETNVRWEHFGLTPTVLNSGTGKMTVDAWNHVVGTYVNTPVRVIYVNGVAVANDTGTGTITSTPGAVLWVGSLFTDNQNLLATIGEVRVYRRALSVVEIMQNYLATKWRYR